MNGPQDMQDEEFSSAGSNLGQSSSQANILHQPQPQLNLATVKDDRDGGTAKMTLGQMALAGIVISSGPGDHFETYEGTVIFKEYTYLFLLFSVCANTSRTLLFENFLHQICVKNCFLGLKWILGSEINF